jgi:peptidoglycan/xylan/chitin deacetylase (PgdA/CDA1 family)
VQKQLKIGLLRALKAMGVFALARRLSGRRLPILCYHGVWLGGSEFAGDSMFMQALTFEARLALIKRLGYRVITLDEAVDMLSGKRAWSKNSIVITIDDGWFSTYQAMLPALRRHGFPATLYCDTANLLRGTPVLHVMARYLRMIFERAGMTEAAERAYRRAMDAELPRADRMDAIRQLAEQLGFDIARYEQQRIFSYMTPDELAHAKNAGLSVGLHTHRHTMHDLTPDAIQAEISDNRRSLAQILATPPQEFRHFCYPSGVYDAGCQAILSSLGVTSATTGEPRLAGRADDPLLLPRIMDGEQLTAIEFEAEISGIGETFRSWTARLRMPGLDSAAKGTSG